MNTSDILEAIISMAVECMIWREQLIDEMVKRELNGIQSTDQELRDVSKYDYKISAFKEVAIRLCLVPEGTTITTLMVDRWLRRKNDVSGE